MDYNIKNINVLNNKISQNNKQIHLLSNKIKKFSNDTYNLDSIKIPDLIESDDYIPIILTLN